MQSLSIHKPSGAQQGEKTLSDRLRSRAFSLDETRAAIRGQLVPYSLARHVTQYSVVHGIRHHPDFATGAAAMLRGSLPLFTRALNARAIMSNQIPDMDPADRPDELPYCIWHPEVPSEDTLQRLLERYPEMQFQVGRACAVAGYTALYRSLDILPEVAVAEEARESGNMEIHDDILKAPVRYKAFDDYTGILSWRNPQPGVVLNGDSCPVSWLKNRQPVKKPIGVVKGETGEPLPEDDDEDDDESGLGLFYSKETSPGFPGYEQPRFNVTEDMQLDVTGSVKRHHFDSPDWKPEYHPEDHHSESDDEFPDWRVLQTTKDTDLQVDLLYQPLPRDLPTLDKDKLIMMAAVMGNTDRYARLRRPFMVEREEECVIRGIYHNPIFARWWASQPGNTWRIKRAVAARYIMSDNLSHCLGPQGREMPYLIWYPDVANPSTYEAIALHVPFMRPQVAHAAIYADYKDLFDLVILGTAVSAAVEDVNHDRRMVSIDKPVMPHYMLWNEARHSTNPYYKAKLEEKAAELGVDITSREVPGWKLRSIRDHHLWGSSLRPSSYGPRTEICDEDNCPYDGVRCETDEIEKFVLLPREWRPTPADVAKLDEPDVLKMTYAHWPESVWSAAEW